MADAQQEQRQQYDEGSFYSEPTPVPNEYRPPRPTYQSTSLAAAASTSAATSAAKFSAATGVGYENHHRHQEASLLNSTLLSLSVDDGGTLPSLTFNPPSPLSQPSRSLFEEDVNNHKVQQPSSKERPAAAAAANKTNGSTTASTRNPSNRTKSVTSPSNTSLSLARRRRQQRVQNVSTLSEISQESHTNGNGTKYPPMHEVYMHEPKTSNDGDTNYYQQQESPSSVGGNSESDTFFECVEDRSLANRAKRTLRSETHSSPSRSVLSSLDGQPAMPNLQYGGQRLENIQENTIGSGDVVRVHESALNALQKLKEELVKSNQRNEELTRDRERWSEEEQNLLQQVMVLQTEDRQKDTDLQRLREDHERLKADRETSETQRNIAIEERKKLEAQSRDSTRTIKEFRHRILSGDNRHKELKGQLDKLNMELEGALSAKGEMAAELARAQTDRMELESKLETFRKQLSEATQERDQTTSNERRFEEELRIERKKLQELRSSSDSEIGRLNSSLRKANEALHRLRAELTPKVRSAVHHQGGFDGMQHTSMVTASSSFGGPPAFGSPPVTLDSAIADRMARLRDSAERAHLIRGHKREIARIKSDREAKIQELESDHLDALKKAAKQLESKRKSELDELAQKLNTEHEAQLEDVEDEHRKRLTQLQKDYGRSREDSDESLEEALGKIARVTQDHGREKGRRHALEKTVETLQRKMQARHNQLQAKHATELEKRKRHWESEKELLLGNLQRDCNKAIANRLRGIRDTTNNAARGNINSNSTNNNDIHIDTSETITPRSMPSQSQGHGYRPPTSSSHHHHHQPQRHHQQQQHPTGPSPISMESAAFFPESSKNHSSHLRVIAPAAASEGGGPPVVTTHGGITSGRVGGSAYIVPSPRQSRHPSSPLTVDDMFPYTNGGNNNNGSMVGGSPSVISLKSYSDMDIDSELRETEELVQSIL